MDIDRVVPPQWPTFSAKKPVGGVWTCLYFDWWEAHSIVLSIQGTARGSAFFGGGCFSRQQWNLFITAKSIASVYFHTPRLSQKSLKKKVDLNLRLIKGGWCQCDINQLPESLCGEIVAYRGKAGGGGKRPAGNAKSFLVSSSTHCWTKSVVPVSYSFFRGLFFLPPWIHAAGLTRQVYQRHLKPFCLPSLCTF